MADVVIMPKLGFDMAEGTLVRWVKNEGDPVSKGEVIAEIETDKATVEVESGFSGFVRRLLVDQGTVLPVNSPIAVIGSQDEDIRNVLEQEPSPIGETSPIKKEKIDVGSKPDSRKSSDRIPSSEKNGRQKISPLARRLAAEKGISPDSLQGTGPGGRIIRRDVDGLSNEKILSRSLIGGLDKQVNISKLRQIIGRRMTESKQQVPHFYVTRNYNVGKLLDVRTQFNGILPDGEKLSVNDFVVKATSLALSEFPNLNASLVDGAILQHGEVNIGIAVAVEGGLLTVVCHEADRKPIRQISQETRQMVDRARSGKVKTDDIEGSTFSLSNLGMFDVDEFVAIINPPEAAILALGSAQETAVVENGIIKTGWRMKATISVDHRISDGAEAARFMQALGKYLEEPIRLVVV
ncbi:MAG: dihydrolipoamide acetyltransferase family protein [Chloroflexota bacterium]